jgi:hypothetical protein
MSLWRMNMSAAQTLGNKFSYPIATKRLLIYSENEATMTSYETFNRNLIFAD